MPQPSDLYDHLDTTVTSGEIYGNIDFAGENSPRNARKYASKNFVTAIDSLGATDFKFYTSPFGNPGIGFFGIPATGNNPTPNFTVNGQGFYRHNRRIQLNSGFLQFLHLILNPP
jgi:hypothetical protein